MANGGKREAGGIWLAARSSLKLALKGDIGLAAERRKGEEGMAYGQQGAGSFELGAGIAVNGEWRQSPERATMPFGRLIVDLC